MLSENVLYDNETYAEEVVHFLRRVREKPPVWLSSMPSSSPVWMSSSASAHG